jgi:hypothetical protein
MSAALMVSLCTKYEILLEKDKVSGNGQYQIPTDLGWE